MSDRPDYVKCVLLGERDSTETWCGLEHPNDWFFVDPTHAALNARDQGRLLICSACAKAIADTVLGHTEETASPTNKHGLGREVP